MGLFSSKSTSSTSQTSNNYDQKVQTGAGGTGVSASGGAVVNVTSIDHGTVGRAFDFAEMMAAGAASQSAASADSLQKVSQSAMQQVQAAYGGLADAYETAKAGEQKIIVVVGLVLLAMVAAKQMGKRV